MAPDLDTQSDAAEQGAWGRPVSARLGEVLIGFALLASGLFFVAQSVLLPFGTVGLPGPGFFPFALGLALGLMAVAIIVRSWRGPIAEEVVHLGHRDVLVGYAALVGVAVVFEQTDAYLTLGTFAAVLLLLVARTAPWRAVVGATLGMVAVWAAFRLALGVRLPASEFWREFAGLIAAKLPPGWF